MELSFRYAGTRLTGGATHHVLVDSNGWEGRRDVLAQRVAELLGQPASRVRATLAVTGTPVAKCGTAGEAEHVVATLRDAGIVARVRLGTAAPVVGGVRVPVAEDASNAPSSDTIQPGWRGDTGAEHVPLQADGSTVVGMPSVKSAMQRTIMLGDGAGRTLSEATSEGAPPPAANQAPDLKGKTPTGAHLAMVGNAAKQVRAKSLLSSAPEPGAWSDVLGGALGAKLLGDNQQSAEAARPSAAPGVLKDQPITPNSAPTMAPVSRRSASTATQLAAGSTRAHGPGWDDPAGKESPSEVFDEAAAQIQSAWPSQYSGKQPLEARPPEPSAPQAAVEAPQAPALGMPSETPSGAWNTSPELGDGFALLRRDEEVATRDIDWPKLNLATFFAVAAPGAGQAYLTSPRDGLVYAFGAPFLKPWVDGVVDARVEVGRIESGAALPRRSVSVLRGAAFVGVFWSVVMVLVVLMLTGLAATRNRPGVALDEAALQAAADERHAAELAMAAAAEEQVRQEAAVAESVASEERATEIRDLLRNAQLACDTENYRLCGDFTRQLLALDSENVRGLRLHALALAEGRNEPDPVPLDASEPAPTDNE